MKKYKVILLSIGTKYSKALMINAVYQLTKGTGLESAEVLVENIPSVIMKSIPLETAKKVENAFNGLGGQVSIEPCNNYE